MRFCSCSGELAAEESAAAVGNHLVPEWRSRWSLVHEGTTRSTGRPPCLLGSAQGRRPHSQEPGMLVNCVHWCFVNFGSLRLIQRATKPRPLRQFQEGSYRNTHQQPFAHVRNSHPTEPPSSLILLNHCREPLDPPCSRLPNLILRAIRTRDWSLATS